MNILLSVNNLGLGGVTTYMTHLATGLAKNHEVIIFDQYPYSSDYQVVKSLPPDIIIESVRRHPFRDKLNWKISAFLKRLGYTAEYWDRARKRYFREVLKKYNIQIITSFDKFSDKIVVEAVGGDVPLVLSIHGSYDISEYYSIPDHEIEMYEKVFRTARAIVYKADCNIRILDRYDNLDNILAVKRIYHGFTAERIGARPSSVRKKLGIPGDAFVFGMIARGVPEKGWREAILAFLDAKAETGKNLHFIAIGGSDYLDALKKEFAYEKAVHFTGFVEKGLDFVNALDVGVLPTYAPTENFTFSVVEYMHCRKPTIASDHGEISVTLDAGGEKAGMLITKINGKPDIVGIKEAMKLYVYNNVLYERHKKLTAKALRKFSSEKAVSDYEGVFNLVLRKSPGH
ncbi:MAG: glycosyltransferase family 4 protein [Bacteroidales bacterium]